MIQRPARLLGINQVLREFPWIVYRFLDGIFRDFRKLDAVKRGFFRDALFPENFIHMPGNSLTLAIKVSGQVHGICFSRHFDDVPDMLLAALSEFVGHREIVVGINRAILRGQIPDMTISSQDLEIRAKVPVDGARLGGRFYDQQFDN